MTAPQWPDSRTYFVIHEHRHDSEGDLEPVEHSRIFETLEDARAEVKGKRLATIERWTMRGTIDESGTLVVECDEFETVWASIGYNVEQKRLRLRSW